MTNPETAGEVGQVHTVGVSVRDQDQALEFYVGVLGFEKRMDVPLGEGRRWVEVSPRNASVTIALELAHDGRPAGVETGIRLTTGDADACHAGLKARGANVDDILRWPGVPPMFAFRDQDGNGLVIVEA